MGTTLELTPATVSTLYAGRTFTDSTGTINALDFHHTEDLLATSGAPRGGLGGGAARRPGGRGG